MANMMCPKLEKVIAFFKAGSVGEIVKTQTTYLDFVCSQSEPSASSATYRIHFQGKRDFSLAKGRITSLMLLEEHPLLLEYVEPFKDIYLSCLVSDKQKFIADLECAASQKFDGWRSLYRYTNGMPLGELLAKRYGLLMSAPASFAKRVMEVAEENGATLNMLEGARPSKEKPHVLLLNTWYVIADDFRAELLA